MLPNIRSPIHECCLKASEISGHEVSHFINYSEEVPYCVFCHKTISEIDQGFSKNFAIQEISLVGAEIRSA